MPPRHNIYLTDPTLWERIQQAARDASARERRDVSASEWLARAAEERLAFEAGKPPRVRGIYGIRDNQSGSIVYVGATVDVRQRWLSHRSDRFSDADRYSYELLEEVPPPNSLKEREDYWSTHYREQCAPNDWLSRHRTGRRQIDRPSSVRY